MGHIRLILQGELLLVPFPFSDQSGKKVRPVIVISNNQFNETSDDVLVVGVTSNISKDKNTTSLDNQDLQSGNLMTKCCIKVENILKLDKELVVKKIGKINEKKINQIKEIIIAIIN